MVGNSGSRGGGGGRMVAALRLVTLVSLLLRKATSKTTGNRNVLRLYVSYHDKVLCEIVASVDACLPSDMGH